jgi:hypothetical protein
VFLHNTSVDGIHTNDRALCAIKPFIFREQLNRQSFENITLDSMLSQYPLWSSRLMVDYIGIPQYSPDGMPPRVAAAQRVAFTETV